jgi:hypothetical protein
MVYLGLVCLYSVSYGLFTVGSRSKKQGTSEKQKSKEAEKRRSGKAEKQGHKHPKIETKQKKHSTKNIVLLEEILHQLVDGASHCNPMFYHVS